jgi:hypothetical protein
VAGGCSRATHGSRPARPAGRRGVRRGAT